MTKPTIRAAAALGLLLAAGTASAAVPGGTYLRKGDQPIAVTVKDGKLYCTRIADGYEMCNGMTAQADGSWKGGKMKHPDMPGFMRFNGTVTFTATGLNIKGCALGMCDSEAWTKQK